VDLDSVSRHLLLPGLLCGVDGESCPTALNGSSLLMCDVSLRDLQSGLNVELVALTTASAAEARGRISGIMLWRVVAAADGRPKHTDGGRLSVSGRAWYRWCPSNC